MKKEGSGSISQRHGSADPDPHQNVIDPQHWFLPVLVFLHPTVVQVPAAVDVPAFAVHPAAAA